MRRGYGIKLTDNIQKKFKVNSYRGPGDATSNPLDNASSIVLRMAFCQILRSILKNYCQERSIMFQDITPHFLSKYESHLREKLDNSTNTVNKDFKFIRKLFNDAYRLDLIEHNQNPFNRYQIKLEKTQRRYLFMNKKDSFLLL